MKANILVDEKIDVRLDPKGNIIESKGNGIIKVSNNTENTTLWAIKLSGTHGPDVVGFNHQDIPHIQSRDPFSDKYTFTSKSKLILIEKVDTKFDNQTGDELNVDRKTLVAKNDQTILIEISLDNRYNFPLENVTVTKNFDECVTGYNPVPPFAGQIDGTDMPLIWKIDKLEANSITSLILSVDLHPSSSDKVKTGEIDVLVSGTDTFTDLEPKIDAECDNVELAVSVKETDQPSMWNVNVQFKNDSEFDTLLETVEVGIPSETFINEKISDYFSPKIDGVAWSKEATIKSNDYPEIKKEFKYQVDYDVAAINSIKIHKETELLNVVEITSNKIFEPEQVNTYTRSDVQFHVAVKNEGTSKIGRLTFDEIIPPYIMVKSVSMEGNLNFDLTSSIEGQEGLDVEKPENIDTARKLFVDVKSINLMPGSTVKLIVNCVSEKPKPNLDYLAPSIVQAFAEVPTTSFKYKSVNVDQPPGLIVAYKTRSFQFNAKYQATAQNQYEIAINVENNGAVPLENVYVTQNIGNSKYLNHSPVVVTALEKSGSIELYIKEIRVNEIVKILLNVETQGPLRQIQPTVKVAD